MKNTLLLLFVFLTISLCGCMSANTPVHTEKISLGLLHTEDNLPFFVAQHTGLFEKNGVEVTLVPFNSARERDVALEAGEIQGELADIVAAAFFRKGGTQVKIVSLGLGATVPEGRFAILSAPDSGINEPLQLQGVPIAVSYNTIIQYLAETMLAECGLKPDKIILQNIPDINIRLESLLSGKEIKAALLPDPPATLAEKAGARVVADDTKLDVNLSQTVIIFREGTLKDRPADIKKILAAYQEAAGNLNKNPQEYKDLIMDKARIPKSLEDTYSLSRFSPLQLPTKDMIDRVITWMVTKQLLEKPFSYEQMVAVEYLPE